ncbi:hypothetical protein BHE74_00002486 [Ensete ventricosum]|nr:hypothetical protein BHE74_00002486 [Ensete ventricosum]
MWKNIITRFGLPKIIITDNGTQFNNVKFKAFCQSYRIQLKFSSVAHPQANGLAEVTNRAILEGLKKRIFGAPTTWVEELPSILWASRTTPKTLTGESPYSLTFGTEAVLPPEVVFPTLQIQTHDEEVFNQQLCENLNLLEEKRADAHLRMLASKRAVARLYNRRVRPRLIRAGDLVLRKAEVSDLSRVRPLGQISRIRARVRPLGQSISRAPARSDHFPSHAQSDQLMLSRVSSRAPARSDHHPSPISFGSTPGYRTRPFHLLSSCSVGSFPELPLGQINSCSVGSVPELLLGRITT